MFFEHLSGSGTVLSEGLPVVSVVYPGVSNRDIQSPEVSRGTHCTHSGKFVMRLVEPLPKGCCVHTRRTFY